MIRKLTHQSPARIIALGFFFTILIGSVLLILPCSIKEGVSVNYIDALYTSTSAVCVTGLTVFDPGDTFTPLGQFFLALLIQIGGLGIAAVGTGIMILLGKKVNIRGRNLIREAMSLSTGKGMVVFIIDIFITTVIFEIIGAVLSFFVFVKDFPVPKAIGVSLFHSVASFNNSGFDILGGSRSLSSYVGNVPLNLITAMLIFFGGIGFLVIEDLWHKKFKWKKLSLHSKVVVSVSLILILTGTLILKFTEDISFLTAFFTSVSARTAGFYTVGMASFTRAGLLLIIVLMFIGASSGSTGGGIKTSTFFVLVQGIKSVATNRTGKAFHFSVPKKTFQKAAAIALLGLFVVLCGTFLLLILEPHIEFLDALFEIVSAFGTVGLSTGVTTGLGIGSKILCMLIMYIGRLGPLTIASLWYFTQEERVKYPDGNISIG